MTGETAKKTIGLIEFIDGRLSQLRAEREDSDPHDDYNTGLLNGSIGTLERMREGIVNGTIVPGCLA